MSWRPLLDGDAARRALRFVDALADRLRQRIVDGVPASLDGLGGEALLFAALDRLHPQSGYAELARTRLDAAFDAIAAADPVPSLWNGFVGIAWVAEQLAPQLHDDDFDANAGVDEALLELVDDGYRRYDLVSGLIGIGVYALSRLERPLGEALLAGVIDRLSELAQPVPFTPADQLPAVQRQVCPRGHVNLGLAHGVPAMLPLVEQAVAHGVRASVARALGDRVSEWLWSQRLPDGAGSAFPQWIAPDAPKQRSRAAWCYGDLGVAMALLHAGRGWRERGLEVAHGIVGRGVEACGVGDASVCHGSAGLALAFARLHEQSGDERFAAEARRWLADLLERRVSEPGAQVQSLFYDSSLGPRYRPDDTLLTGATGVGLVLLAAASSIAPDWDRALLFSR